MKKFLILLIPAFMAVQSCSHKATYVVKNDNSGVAIGYTKTTKKVENESPQPTALTPRPEGMILKASAFKMSGDYSDNVAVTLDSKGNLTYFPAPSDIRANSRPVDLGDGWWLNCQGIGLNSVFTKYTFEEYSKLKSTPTPAELKAAIIPGARVIEMVQLPCAASEARSQIAEIKEYLKNER